jgi:hypothetical protein
MLAPEDTIVVAAAAVAIAVTAIKIPKVWNVCL